MSVKIEQMYTGKPVLYELRQQLKRIPDRFQECMQVNIRSHRIRTQGGRYSAWDFPETLFHDLRVKIK